MKKHQWGLGFNCFRVVIVLFSLLISTAFAYHPIATVGPFDQDYPKWPKVDYGSGDQAKLIKRGEYLARAGDCLACHTNVEAGGKPFSGALPIATPFGEFYSPNITPDKETGIGTWTEKEFIRAMQEGISPQGHYYFPVFPYVYFNKVSKDDLRAIFAYLKVVPAVRHENKAQGFPFNMPGARAGLWFWRAMYFDDQGEYDFNPRRSEEWNRGAYLVEGLGHCSMCHTPMNMLGGSKDHLYMTGAFVDGYWAPNITSYGLKSASIYEIADVFVDGQLINKAGPVSGPMAEVNHYSLRYLNEKDRIAIATYLKTVNVADPRKIDPSDSQDPLKLGKQVYINACVMCHQDGKASAPIIGDGPAWLHRAQTQGIDALYRHTINGFNNMPARGACVNCSDHDIRSAVDYILHESLNRNQWHDVKLGKVKPTLSEIDGKAVYQENCALCHDEGKLGAPKIGDKTAWQPLVRQNFDQLILHTIKGQDGMHVRGGCRHCSDSELIAAVKYLVTESSDQNFALW